MKSNHKKKVFDALREEAVTNQSGNNEVQKAFLLMKAKRNRTGLVRRFCFMQWKLLVTDKKSLLEKQQYEAIIRSIKDHTMDYVNQEKKLKAALLKIEQLEEEL